MKPFFLLSNPVNLKRPKRIFVVVLIVLIAGATGSIFLQNRAMTVRHHASEEATLSSRTRNEIAAPSARAPVLAAEKGGMFAQSDLSTAGMLDLAGIEKLARTDPSRALALTLSGDKAAPRDEGLQAVLRGWAKKAPYEAAKWSLAQTFLDKGLALSAVFNGTKENSDAAVLLAKRLSQEHPEDTGSYGRYLIFSLGEAEKFVQAANFAATSSKEVSTDLLTAAYANWARRDPERAVLSALEFADPGRQTAAFQAAIDAWALSNPQELTNAASRFPEGPDRSLALISALRSWIAKDPPNAAIWIAQHTLSEKEAALILEE